jgi:hypothetical protein
VDTLGAGDSSNDGKASALTVKTADGYFHASHEARVSTRPIALSTKVAAVTNPISKRAPEPLRSTNGTARDRTGNPSLKYIRRDMDEVRADVRTIKHRLAYSAGATAVIMGLLGWVANSRFDQLVTLMSQ